MSDPSGDTPKPPSSTPPPVASEPAGNNLTVLPRANPPSVFNQKAVQPAADTPPGFAEFMNWMKSFSGAPLAPEEAVPPGRTLIPKEQKKFSRQTAESATTTVAPAATVPPVGKSAAGNAPVPNAEEGVENAAADTSPRKVPLLPVSVERKRRGKEPLPKRPTLVLLTQVGAFALIVGSFFLGRATVPRQAIPTPSTAPAGVVASKDGGTPGILPADLAAKVDEANAAESDGDLKRATKLLEEVQQAGGRVHGLTFHLATLAFSQGDWLRVLPLLNASIAQGEEVAASYNLRGTMMNRTQGIGKGLADLQLAAQLDPFEASYAFFVGEAMRRLGKPQAAQEYLRQAIQRQRDPSQKSTYELKLRLAQIEADQGKQFASEMAAKLALDPAPPDWLLTAAAVALQHEDLWAASLYLDKAQAQLGKKMMQERLRDFYFYSYADNPELARYFLASTPSLPAPASPPASALDLKAPPAPTVPVTTPAKAP